MNTTIGVAPHRGAGLACLAGIFMLMVFVPASTLAQGHVSASVFGGVTLPTGDLGDDVGEEAGLATPGGVLGVDVGVPLGLASGFSWQSTLEGAMFGVDDEMITDLFGSVADIDLGHYWASVLHTGARYTFDLNPFTRLHGTAQVSLGVFKAPGATITVMGERAEIVTEWGAARGYAVGGGLTLSDRVELNVRYGRLINPEVNGEIRYQGMVEELDAEQDVSWVQATVGVRLR